MATLDRLLLEVGAANLELGLLHLAAQTNLGGRAMAGQSSCAFTPLASVDGTIPMPMWAWRKALREAHVLPPGTDADWMDLCRPLRAPVFLPARPAPRGSHRAIPRSSRCSTPRSSGSAVRDPMTPLGATVAQGLSLTLIPAACLLCACYALRLPVPAR